MKKYELVFLGDREFHGVELSYWLKTKNKKALNPIYFIFRQKQGTYFKKHKQQYQKLSSLGIAPGTKIFLSKIQITKNQGFGYFNLAAYWKRKYNKKIEKEPWYLLILLIALAYTTSILQGKSIKNSGQQKYIARLTEAQRHSNRHSNFGVGLYGNLWVIAWDFLRDTVQDLMNLSLHKLPSYQNGLKVMSMLQMA